MPSGWFPPPERDPSLRSATRRETGLGHGPAVVEIGLGGVRGHIATRSERLSSYVHGERLDRALADGTLPELSTVLALRANRLACPESRRLLAQSLVRLLRGRPTPVRSVGVLRSRHLTQRVAAVSPEIQSLVDQLLAPVPVSARGVALVQMLLTDGTGPLYRGGSTADLRRLLREASGALAPWADWQV